MTTKTSPSLRFAAAAGLAAAVLAGCAVGPNYKRPSVAAPPEFKELAGWKQAEPNDDARRGDWWKVFGDAELDDLEAQVASSNQTVLQAMATYEEARQVARSDNATFWPSISADGSATRSKEGSHGGAVTSAGGGLTVVPTSTAPVNTFTAGLDASWSPDFWGRLRRQTEADVTAAQSSAANLANSRLSLQSMLATDYVGLRVTDDKNRLLENAVEAYRRTLSITQNKYGVGVAARSDVISAQAQLDATLAQEIDLGIQRAQFEHAIAVLVGKAPADLTIARRVALGLAVPSVPPGLPAELLERRPDVAAAERSAASANAKVGVQTAAYFPDLTLSAEGGYEGSALRNLISAPNQFWSLGGSLSDTLFDFGQRRAELLEAKAAWNGAVAGYRQTVLTAFQQVEDDLAGLRILERESVVEARAVTEATQAAAIAVNEYRAGTVDYTTVVTAQVNELTNREADLTILQERLDDSVTLMQALGGGWNQDDLPDRGKVLARNPKNSSGSGSDK